MKPTNPAQPEPSAAGLPHSAIQTVPRWQSMLRSLALARDPLPVLDATLERYGDTVELYIGGVRKSLLTRDPGLVQHVLQKNSRHYAKSEFTQDFARYVGRGLLTNEGADWLRQRRLIQPGFHRQRVAGLTGLMQTIINETLAPLATQAAQQGGIMTVSAHALMTQLTFRIIARSVFSTNLPEAELERMADAITRLQTFYVRRIRQPYLRPWFWLSGRTRRHDKLAAELRELLGAYLARRQPAVGAGAKIPTPLAAAQAPNAAPAAAPDDLLQMLLDARYEDTGAAMAPERVLDEALILLVAGHETSANALTWLLYLLAQHPEEAAIIQREMAAVLAGRAPTFADLPQLNAALYAVQEAMRLYPPAWMVDRVALADDEYQDLKIPKGTLFSLYLYGLHHDPKSWAAPAEFRPARFAPESAAPPRHPFAYAPFGGGPRLCIGLQFALTEMQLVVLELLRVFDVEEGVGNQPPVPMQPLITLRPKHDFEVQLRLR